MFWGLVVKPNNKYTSRVKKAFHISQAVLDSGSNISEKSVKLILQRAGEPDYILCVLQKSGTIQVSLDLNFAKDDEITFVSIGGTIHLSGYTENDRLDDISEDNEEEGDDTGDEEDDVSYVNDEDTDEEGETSDEDDDDDGHLRKNFVPNDVNIKKKEKKHEKGESSDEGGYLGMNFMSNDVQIKKKAKKN